MDKDFITKKELHNLLVQAGVKAKSVVLLQASDEAMDAFLGGAASLVEEILDMIGPRGTLIVPAFTMNALDPACQNGDTFQPENWERIRLDHPGYSSRTLPADLNREAASALILHTKAKRTEHPVYSLTWLGGPIPYKPILDTLDYPLSYQHILEDMKSDSAINLLVGVDLDQAIYPLLEAHRRNKDVSIVQSAFVRRVKKLFEEKFLTSYLDEENREEIINDFNLWKKKSGSVLFQSLRLKAKV